MKAAGGKRGFVEARLLTDWTEIAGTEIATFCRPVKVSYASRSPGLGATLVVTAEGARAPEVEMRARLIIERVNAFYGYRAIARVTIDQSRFYNAPAKHSVTENAAPGATPVGGVENGDLALALGRLGANIKRKAATSAQSRRDQ